MADARTITAAEAGTITIGEDLAVNRIGFGAMRITGDGIWGEPDDPDAARDLLRRAIELGVNFIDTADAYGPEVSENLIAEALHPYPEDLVIATKGGLTRHGPGDWRRDCRPERLKKCCEASLGLLRLERIDVYQLHAVDPKVPLEDSVGALAELREQGKVRHVGLCNVGEDELARARRIVPIVSVQDRYSAADRASEPVLEACEREGHAFIPWFPLGAGSLSAVEQSLRRAAEAHGASVFQVALAWLLQHSPAILPIPGTSSRAHLEENVAAAAVSLTEGELEELGG
jgi:pyridoxine 4-dehydrogenase